MGRHRNASLATVFLLDDSTKAFEGHVPLPYLKQGAYDGPHHIAQKPVSLDAKHQQTVLFQPSGFHDTTIVGLNLGMHLREACKILIIKQKIGGLLHFFQVQVTIKEESIIEMKRILRARDIIMISARKRIETGVSFGLDLKNPINDNVGRKEGIELVDKSFRITNCVFQIEVGVIVAGMDTRIGAATACDGDGLSEFEAQALLHRLLDAIGVRLDLVAMIAAAVVGQMDEITRHRCDFSAKLVILRFISTL